MYDKINYPFYSKTNKQNTKSNTNSQSRNDCNNYRYYMNNQSNNQNSNYNNNQNANYLKRKQDTKKKIMLGGLIIKAGLDYLHPQDVEVLYGMLLTDKKLLNNNPEIAECWREIGKDLKKI